VIAKKRQQKIKIGAMVLWVWWMLNEKNSEKAWDFLSSSPPHDNHFPLAFFTKR
jgi:hypothetical protein